MNQNCIVSFKRKRINSNENNVIKIKMQNIENNSTSLYRKLIKELNRLIEFVLKIAFLWQFNQSSIILIGIFQIKCLYSKCP